MFFLKTWCLFTKNSFPVWFPPSLLLRCLRAEATLRCKQQRMPEAAVMLEEVAKRTPPHPATLNNLGTAPRCLLLFFHSPVPKGTTSSEVKLSPSLPALCLGKHIDALPDVVGPIRFYWQSTLSNIPCQSLTQG